MILLPSANLERVPQIPPIYFGRTTPIELLSPQPYSRAIPQSILVAQHRSHTLALFCMMMSKNEIIPRLFFTLAQTTLSLSY